MHAKKWIARSIVASLLWVGFVHDVDGARNVVLFWLWLGAVLSPLSLTKAYVMEQAKQDPESAIEKRIGIAWRIAVLLFLVWHGAFASAVAWAFFALIFGVREELAKRVRDGQGGLPWA